MLKKFIVASLIVGVAGVTGAAGAGIASAGCPASGETIASRAKTPGANAGPNNTSTIWLAEPGRPNTPGQSIKFSGKIGPGC